MLDLDRFPDVAATPRGIHSYCPNCGKPVLGMNTKCVDCTEQEWFETVASLNMDQFMDRLDGIFEGNEKDFRWDGGMMELTYYGNAKEVAKGKRLLEARGTVKMHVAEDKLQIWLASYKDQLEIY